MTMTGDLLGTLRYMSPEQALAKRVVVDHRSDIYSLGVTLYELLTLQPAFTGDDRQELLRQIAFDEPRKPRQINARIPQDLETIVLKAIEKNPADRYATAQELADDLRHFIRPADQGQAADVARSDSEVVAAASGGCQDNPDGPSDSADRSGRGHGLGVTQASCRKPCGKAQSMALDEAESWYRAGKLSEAMSAVTRAEGFLISAKGSDESKLAVTPWRNKLIVPRLR